MNLPFLLPEQLHGALPPGAAAPRVSPGRQTTGVVSIDTPYHSLRGKPNIYTYIITREGRD